MKQCGVLRDKELFDGSDIVRRYTYKTGNAGDIMPFLGKRIVLYAAHHMTECQKYGNLVME